MRMRSWAGALLLAAWLAGCTAGSGTGPAPAPPTSPAPPAASGEGAPPAPASGGVVSAFPVKPAPGALERVTYGSSLAIPGPGTYAVDLTTGKVEAWLRPGAQAGEEPAVLSEDRRWAVLQVGNEIYWANRATGQVYGWPSQDLGLLAEGSNRFLFARPGGAAYHVTDDTFRVLCTFTLDLGQRTVDQALFAPDGKTVAINTARWLTVDSNPADGRLYVVDTATGAVRDLGAPPAPAAG
ncbi:MAG TPA: hypothetical protein VK464_09580, partial [Symbiobacteriaceae bacterium]|nr:hypothetical protein [Symbiobacteriaceae bacterium]